MAPSALRYTVFAQFKLDLALCFAWKFPLFDPILCPEMPHILLPSSVSLPPMETWTVPHSCPCFSRRTFQNTILENQEAYLN